MKLISCHIEGFGKYCNTDFSFSDGLNCFVRENGSGKTTLTAFLRAMFYGMDGYRSDARGFPDRMHYYPWGKGGNAAFGGNIIFEKEGSTYRIERFFGEKNAKDDRMTVYRNGFLCTDLGECPGKTIFGLDADSFIRTVFFMSDDTAVESSVGINRVLIGIPEGDDDRPGAEEAAAKLRDKAYEIRSKSRKTGLAYDTEDEIFNIKNRLFNLKSIEDTLERRYITRAEYEKAYSSLREKKKQAEAYAVLLSKKKIYEDKLSAKKAVFEKLSAIENKYAAGIPDAEQCETLSSAAVLLPELKARYESCGFPAEKLERLSVLHNSYPHGFPGDEEFEELKNIISDCAETEQKIKNTVFNQEERLSALSALFSEDGVPDSSEYDEMRDEADLLLGYEKTVSETSAKNPSDTAEYKRLSEKFSAPVPAELPEMLENEAGKYTEAENKLQQLINRVTGEEKKKFRLSWIPVIIMIISVCFLGAGVILLLLQNAARIPVMIAGSALLAASIVTFAIDSWLQSRKKGSRDFELMALSAEKKNCAARIFSALADYGYSGEDPLSLLTSFNSERQRYLYLKSETEKCSLKLAELAVQTEELRTDIDAFLEYHGIQSGLMTNHGLRSAIDRSEQIRNEFRRLNAEKRESTAKTYVLEEHRKKLLTRCRTLLIRYSLPENSADSQENLNRIINQRSEYNSLYEEKKRSTEKRQELSNHMAETMSIISGILSPFGFDCPEAAAIPGLVTVFSKDREVLSGLRTEYTRLENDCEEFRINNIPDNDPPVPEITARQADAEIDTVLRNISAVEREIEGCENEASLIPGYEEKLREATEKLSRLDEKRKILLSAADAIESAERSLKERYISPIREKFSSYAGKLAAVPDTAFSMDENFNVSFEAAGAWHRDRSLSTGQQICCSLALRMSLIECIYGDGKPFLIFDDPFSGLDGKRLSFALSLLKKLSEEYQILYFCCHESRAI